MSVVVAARNESDNLPRLLEALSQQIHPAYEVVIVDDASSDETALIAEEWAADRPNAHVVHVTDPVSPRKKHAIAKGIAATKHDLLAVTDADCTPPPDWLSVLAATHENAEDEVVLVGYSPLQGRGLLALFSRYETFLQALYAMAAIGWGRPYMGVARNLSYPRSVFERVNGFSHSKEMVSGDDDLFIQEVHRQDEATVRPLLDTRTFVPTQAPTSWRTWVRRRRRHVSAGRQYPWDVGLHLTLLHASLVLLWLAPFFLGVTGIGLLATGLLARHSALGRAAETFSEPDLLAAFPLWEFGYALYHITIVPFGLLFPPDQW